MTDTETDRVHRRAEDDTAAVVGARYDGPTVWVTRTAHLVGILLGHHGTGHLLCHLRHSHRHVCVLRRHKTGTCEQSARVRDHLAVVVTTDNVK